MIGFANDHDLVTKSKTIKNIVFHGVENNQIDSLVSGKKKRGGVQINKASDICTITNGQG